MAVTINTTPNNWNPSDNPVVWTFESDQTGQANFSFKIEVTIGGSLAFTDKIFPEVGNVAHYDVLPRLRAAVNGPQLLDALQSDSGTNTTVSIKVIENYGTPPTDQASATTATVKVWKARVNNQEYVDKDFQSDYVLQKWLTDYPANELIVVRGQDVIHGMIGNGLAATLDMNFYDANDVLLHNYSVGASHQVWQINSRDDLLTTVAGVPAIDNVAYYTLQIDSSDIFTVRYADLACNIQAAAMWVNKYGIYDQFAFTHSVTFGGDGKASGYTSQFGEWQGSTYTFDPLTSGDRDYFNRTKIRGQATTEYITEEQQNWLTEIFNGAGHILFNDSNNTGIKLTRRTFNKKTQRFDELFAESIEFTLSYTDQSPTL